MTHRLVAPRGSAPARWESTGAAASAEGACSFFAAPGAACEEIARSVGSVPKTGTSRDRQLSGLAEYALGTRICVSLSVRDRARGDGRWAHAVDCTTVGKSPKVQIRGGDLLQRDKDSAVVTSTARIGGRTYGSWGEYAVMAAGDVRGTASGAGYSGGSEAVGTTPCAVSLLTFANAETAACTNSGPRGGFVTQRPPADMSARFKPRTALPPGTSEIDVARHPSGTYVANADLRLTASAPLAKGHWIVIIAASSRVTIATDVRYTDARLASAAEIPQLLVFAKQIAVSEAVGQVDSWLVASDSISTCAEITDPRSQLTASRCDRTLRVNGPVRTARIHLYRTAGSDPVRGPGAPAEIFNLRPDAYMWANEHFRETTTVRTSSTRELPPRF